jgi:hypothetical protein
MQKSGPIGKLVVQVMVFFVIISMSAFAVAAPPGSQTPQVQTGSQRLKQPLPIPDQSLSSSPDIKAISLDVYHANSGDQGPWKPGETVRIRGYYHILGCLQKPFFGKITMDGNTLIEQEMEQRPDCQGYSNTMVSFDANFVTNWQATMGTHTIVFTVDSKDNIQEGLNESNNTLNKTITVQVSTLQKKDLNTQPMLDPEIIKPKPEPPGWK